MAAPTVLLFTDRPELPSVFQKELEQHGVGMEALSLGRLVANAKRSAAAIVDGESARTEDDLLQTVSYARARGAIVAVALEKDAPSLDDVLEEMCPGLVARRESDVPRVCQLLARKLDLARGHRFEYVTTSPRGGELLAVLGDGRAHLVPRPLGKADHGREIDKITLSADAETATVHFERGGEVALDAKDVITLGVNGVDDGVKLGARIRELRLEAGLTQAELSRRTGIHRPNIARVEAGRHTPSIETIARIATAMGVSTTRVLADD